MRALLWCSLGAVVLWFTWHALSGSNANAGYEPTSPGTMLAPESAPASAAPAAEGGASKTLSAPAEERKPAQDQPVSAAERAPATPASPVAPAPAPAAVSVLSEKVELELARALVSAPEDFCTAIEKREDLPSGRRKLALALGRALEGRTETARALAAEIEGDPLVRSSERDFLTRLLGGRVSTAQAASATTESPLTWAALMISESHAAEGFEREGKAAEAARTWSGILLDSVRAPFGADPAVLRRWSASLAKNQRRHRWNRNGEWPSISVKVASGDSLIGVRKRVLAEHPEMLLCTGQIVRANEMRDETLRAGETLRIPTDRARVLVDLDAHWAFYLLGEEVAAAYEVGVGKDGATRAGSFVVGAEKRKDPMWFRQGGSPVPFGDPENPLGTRWIPWNDTEGQKTGLAFHGTKDPTSIGKDESQGCIRMHNADVEELFEILPVGAVVTVQP